MEINYTHLIYKSLEGQLDNQEQQQLNEWLQADKANELNYQQILKIWQSSEGENYPDLDQQLNVDRAYDTVMAKLKPQAKIVKSSSWVLRIAASLLILVGLGGLMYLNVTGDNNYEQFVTTDERSSYTLPDNSVVWLEANTTLHYHKDFNESRSLKLDGIATFEVTHDKEKPFVISTKAVDVTVLGTKFIVGAEEDKDNYVDVINGRVKVQNAIVNTDTLILTKGMKASVTSDNLLSLDDDVDSNDMFWATQQLSYNNESLVNIFEDLMTYYDVSIEYARSDFRGCVFQGSFTEKSIDQVLSSLKLIYNLEVEEGTNNIYKLKGNPCN